MKLLLAGALLGAILAIAAVTLSAMWFIVVVLVICCLLLACIVLAMNASINSLREVAEELAGMPPEVCGFCGTVPEEPDRVIIDVLIADETVHVPVHVTCAQEKIPYVVKVEA